MFVLVLQLSQSYVYKDLNDEKKLIDLIIIIRNL